MHNGFHHYLKLGMYRHPAPQKSAWMSETFLPSTSRIGLMRKKLRRKTSPPATFAALKLRSTRISEERCGGQGLLFYDGDLF